MSITSMKINGLEVLSTTYWVGEETYYAIAAGPAEDARLVSMAGRYPAYVGSDPQARDIPLLIIMLARTATQRMLDYEALLTYLSNAAGLIALEWTDSTTRRYWCHVDSVVPDKWVGRVAVALTAPNPYAEVI
jgi:hypothetical protein